jgi:hypothetical protein
MQERANAPAAQFVWPKVGQMIYGKLDCHLFCCSRGRRPRQFGFARDDGRQRGTCSEGAAIARLEKK